MGKTLGPGNGGEEKELSAERERALMQGGKKKNQKGAGSFADFFKTEHTEPNVVEDSSSEPLLANSEPILDLPPAEENQAEPVSSAPQIEKIETKKLPPISPNSRLYRQFAPVFKQNKHEEQINYRDLNEYLNHMMSGLVTGEESLPVGCQSPADLLKPYWETAKIAGVPMASYFALEHILEFQQSPRLREQYNSEESYFKNLLENFSLPQDAENMEDAIRPLNEEEVKTWFRRRQRGLEDYYKKQAGVRNFKQLAFTEYTRLGYDAFKDYLFAQDPGEVHKTSPIKDEDSQAYFKLDKEHDADFYQLPNDTRAFVRGNVKRYMDEQIKADKEAEKKAEKTGQPKAVRHQTGFGDQNIAYAQEALLQNKPIGKYNVTPQMFRDSLFTKGNPNEKGAELVDVLPIKNVKFTLDGDQVTINFNKRVEKKGVGFYLPKPSYIHVNLPPGIVANYTAYQQDAEKIIYDLVSENEGRWQPVMTYGGTFLELGLGESGRSRMIDKVSFDSIKQKNPEIGKEIDKYKESKSKPLEDLKFEEEKQPMWNLETKMCTELYLPYDGRQVTLSQYVWDKAFKEALEAKLGSEKLAELKKEILSSQPAPVVTKENKPQAPPEPQPQAEARAAEQGRELPKADEVGFLKTIEQEFAGNYLEFVKSGSMENAAKKFHLSFEDAYLVVAKKALSPEECQRFESLYGMTEAQIVQDFFGGDAYYAKRKKGNLIKNALIWLLREPIKTPKVPDAAPASTVGRKNTPPPAGNGTDYPRDFKFRKEPKTETKVEDKQIWPEAEYYPDFQTVHQVMDKYGRLDVDALKRQTNLSEYMLQPILERALAAMGFLKDYQAGLIDFKNNTDYQKKIVDRARALQNDWLRQGRQIGEVEAYHHAEREMDFELLVKAVESFYHIRPETLKFEEEKLRVPPSFEEAKYIQEPKSVVMRDKVSGFEYFGIPGPQGTWDKVPLPDNINIDDPKQMQELYKAFSDMVKDNDSKPVIQLKGADGENFRDGRFEIYIDRTLVKTVPVRQFLNRGSVREDVRNQDRNNEIYKELLVKSFAKSQLNQTANFAQRDTRVQALEDLLLNTPLQDNVSFGDEAKFAALKRRLAALYRQRVQGSVR